MEKYITDKMGIKYSESYYNYLYIKMLLPQCVWHVNYED